MNRVNAHGNVAEDCKLGKGRDNLLDKTRRVVVMVLTVDLMLHLVFDYGGQLLSAQRFVASIFNGLGCECVNDLGDMLVLLGISGLFKRGIPKVLKGGIGAFDSLVNWCWR